MVGIQFIMTMSFSFLSPIMPLFLPELGVTSDAGIALWSGILNGSTSFVAAFASPLWGRLADLHGRKLMLLRSSCAIACDSAGWARCSCCAARVICPACTTATK